jgi:hypothetical protein
MRTKFFLHAMLALGGITLLTSVSSLHAAGIVNGGFETGDFTGWNTDGNTSIQDSTFGSGPTEGKFDALISNGAGTGTTGGPPVSATQLATDLNLSSTYFTSLGFVNGSVIHQKVTVAATDKLSFDYNFLTNEANNGTGNPDTAFFLLITSPAGTVVNTLNLGTPPAATLAAPIATGFSFMSGFASQAPTAFGTAGTYDLSFLALNYGDTLSSSALLLDNVAINGSTNGGTGGTGGAVPLPAGVYLFPLGALLAAGYGLRLRNRATA